MERIIAGIILLIIILNTIYTIFSIKKFVDIISSESVKIYILMPFSVIFFGICMYIIFGFNLYYYWVKSSIGNLLSAILCLVMANQILLDSLFAINEKLLILGKKKLEVSKIQKIVFKNMFIFSFLKLVIVHMEDRPQISFFISKKVKKIIVESNWYKNSMTF